MKSMRLFLFHWRGLSAAVVVKLDRYRFNGVTLTGFLLLMLFFVGLPALLLPFQTVKTGPNFLVTLLHFNWLGFLVGLCAMLQLLIVLDAMVQEGVVFDADRNQMQAPNYEIDAPIDFPIRVYGQFHLGDQQSQFFQRALCGIRIHPYGGFTFFSNINASVHHSFMLIPSGTDNRSGEWIIHFPPQARITFSTGEVYWNLHRQPALRIHDDLSNDSKADVTLCTDTIAQRDTLTKCLRNVKPVSRTSSGPPPPLRWKPTKGKEA